MLFTRGGDCRCHRFTNPRFGNLASIHAALQRVGGLERGTGRGRCITTLASVFELRPVPFGRRAFLFAGLYGRPSRRDQPTGSAHRNLPRHIGRPVAPGDALLAPRPFQTSSPGAADRGFTGRPRAAPAAHPTATRVRGGARTGAKAGCPEGVCAALSS